MSALKVVKHSIKHWWNKKTNLLLVQADQVGTSYDLELLLVNLLSLAVGNGLSSIKYWDEGKPLENNSVIYTFSSQARLSWDSYILD